MQTNDPHQPAPARSNWLLRAYQPDPPITPVQLSPEEIAADTRAWRLRILIFSMLGYAMYYFVRKNLSLAMPAMSKDLGITKTDLGLFLTLHGLIYGVSKFANGFWGDRANARRFMATGLVLSAVCNIFFGLSSTVFMLGTMWMLNGWVQGMGFPPNARLLTHWFSPKELARKMSIWNTSHSIGAGLVVILCGYLARHDWRLCFFVPAGLAIVTGVILMMTLKDSPESVGLPSPLADLKADTGENTPSPSQPTDTTTSAQQEEESFNSFVRRQVFSNPFIWIIALANFFVYTVRYAVLDWGPTFLQEAKGFELHMTGWMVAAFEISGIIGMLASGWITDKIFGGRGSRTCLLYMIFCMGAVALFWKLPNQTMFVSTSILCLAGFFIYGPQALVGIAVANLATRRAAATAVGLTGIFGYASTLFSGWGLGYVVEHFGWDKGFQAIFAFGIIGTLLFAAAWPAKAHGYK